MTATARSHDVRSVLIWGFAVGAIAATAGALHHLSLSQWLGLLLSVALVLWVGGAVSGQVILAMLLDSGTNEQALAFTRQLLPVILAFYIPMSVVAFGSGVALMIINGWSFTSGTVLIPVALYAMTCVAGAAFSGPGYRKLLRFADANGADHPEFRRRLIPLARLNRVELALVIGVGIPTIISAFKGSIT